MKHARLASGRFVSYWNAFLFTICSFFLCFFYNEILFVSNIFFINTVNISVDWKNSKFIWGTVPPDTTGSSLDLDNDILFWYRKCDAGGTPPSGQGMPLLRKIYIMWEERSFPWQSDEFIYENTVRVKFQNIKMMLKFLNKVEMKPNKKNVENILIGSFVGKVLLRIKWKFELN